METNSSRDPNGCHAEGNPLSTGEYGLLLNRSARQHRPERTAGKDVHVEVGHLLPRVRPGIGEQAIAPVDQPRFARNLAYSTDEPGDLGIRSLGRKVVPGNVGAPGNDQ